MANAVARAYSVGIGTMLHWGSGAKTAQEVRGRSLGLKLKTI